jgi:hypothetical protein
LYGIFFSSRLNRTLWQNGPKTAKIHKSNQNPGVKSQTNDTHKNINQNLQSPRILGAPTAALTQISKAIISVRGRNSSERLTGVETDRESEPEELVTGEKLTGGLFIL